ncbi:general stress protein [Agromyces intestinalis]|uniref:general stress protein n=1 Tax=Agromyces intestinalis TaxID=2592652 RepID=UPI001AEF48AB|nr:general stress protein [Agromyces intestinalis]
MSSPSPFRARAAQQFPSLPKGETVASYETYPEAQAAVDRLAKAEFPVSELSIVGTDLTSVERITGKLTWGRVAGGGALSGAWFGTFLGLLFFIFSPTGAGLGILGSAILIGAGFGMIFGLVSYSINRRRRDFTSTMQVIATRYAIIAEPAHVERARTVLGVDAPIAGPAVSAAPGAPGGSAAGSAGSAGSAGQTAGQTGSDASPAPRTYGEATDAAKRAKAEADAAASRPARPQYGEYAPDPADAAAESGDATAPSEPGGASDGDTAR